MRATHALIPAVLIALAALPAAAQDWTIEPTYGTVELEAGFLPDPQSADITAGGSIEVDIGDCSYGNVADAPDIDMYYRTGGSTTLYIYVRSSKDTTLLINRPDGTWVCNDDDLGSLNPLVVIPNAPDGLYNIWVGTYGDGMTPATISVSEIDPR